MSGGKSKAVVPVTASVDIRAARCELRDRIHPSRGGVDKQAQSRQKDFEEEDNQAPGSQEVDSLRQVWDEQPAMM